MKIAVIIWMFILELNTQKRSVSSGLRSWTKYSKKENERRIKMKVLKIKVGSVYIDGKSHDVFEDAWEKTSKDGKKYYQISKPVFVSTIEKKEEQGA